MSIFAPVYRPTKHQQTFLVRQQKLESKKRKRGQDSNDEDVPQTPTERSAEADEIPQTASSSFHPVNGTDPYHVAGHPREYPLPPPPFPHAAVKEASQAKRSIEEELAGLNPPLYVPSTAEDKSTSLRRRHLDNLTTILHRCMLKGDWHRAFRAWGLLIRSEIAGRCIDVRRNGRWSIGAELLMRRDERRRDEHHRDPSNDDQNLGALGDGETEQPLFSAEGFKLAREYYERLILQYPHTARTTHTFNATAVYPALFNVWIYEVQDRSKQARKSLESEASRSADEDSNDASLRSSDSRQRAQLHQIRAAELEHALPIAQRMDELFQSPPYDSDSELRRLRGMVARWISHLHREVAAYLSKSLEAEEDDYDSVMDPIEVQSEIDRHRARAEEERVIATRSLEAAS